MNKKGQFVAFLALLLVLALAGIYFFLSKDAKDIVIIYYTPADVLNNNAEIKEYKFDLNQDVKYSSFKAFDDLTENSGLYKKCVWYEKNCELNLEEDFKSYFLQYFKEPFEVYVKIKDNKFVISGKGSKTFTTPSVKTDADIEFEYVLDYNIDIITSLYENCRKVTSCDKEELIEKICVTNKCDDSSDENYIKMEYFFKPNSFVEPKLLFKISKSVKLEG